MGESLYDRLGGRNGIDTVVTSFYDRVLDDESLVGYFEDTDTEALREHQRAFLSSVTGGPEQYDGASMRAAHAHLDLTADDFAAVADHLDAALREAGVADDDRQAVLSAVSGFEAEILDQ